MLPHLTKSLSIAALTLASLSPLPAQAWGKSEQDVLTGILGTLAVQAMIRHEEAHRAAPAPAPTPRPTQAELPYQPGVSIHRTPAARAFNSYSPAERKRIQRNLRAYGYYRGGADGAFGPATYAAVVAYAQDQGMSGNLGSTNGAFGLFDSLIY